MKSIDTPSGASARIRTDESLQGERQLLDELARECPPAVAERIRRLGQARRQTDMRLSDERAQTELALSDGSSSLFLEHTARELADVALADRETLLATFGHDLRNLLNVLAVNAELSLKGAANPRSMGDVLRTVRRMDSLISNLLDHARLKAGTFHVAFDWRNAAEVIGEAVEIFKPLAAARSLSLNAASPLPDLPIRIDSDRIFQVLSNLFSNAISVTPQGGSIFVAAARVADGVQITVRDSGRGIAETDLERIFNPYCQLDHADRRGLGLGLFISKSIVQAHGGQIWAESKLGVGSTFHFTVPGDVGAPAAVAAPARFQSMAQ